MKTKLILTLMGALLLNQAAFAADVIVKWSTPFGEQDIHLQPNDIQYSSDHTVQSGYLSNDMLITTNLGTTRVARGCMFVSNDSGASDVPAYEFACYNNGQVVLNIKVSGKPYEFSVSAIHVTIGKASLVGFYNDGTVVMNVNVNGSMIQVIPYWLFENGKLQGGACQSACVLSLQNQMISANGIGLYPDGKVAQLNFNKNTTLKTTTGIEATFPPYNTINFDENGFAIKQAVTNKDLARTFVRRKAWL